MAKKCRETRALNQRKLELELETLLPGVFEDGNHEKKRRKLQWLRDWR